MKLHAFLDPRIHQSPIILINPGLRLWKEEGLSAIRAVVCFVTIIINVTMFQSLLTLIRKQNYLPVNAFSSNVFFFINNPSFSYKLTNWTMWYVYLTDSLKSITLRVYNKNWNNVFLIIFFSYMTTLSLIMLA